MNNLHRNLVSDLISDDHNMLWHHEEPPYIAAIYTGTVPNPEVLEALERILETLMETCEPQNVHQDSIPYIPFIRKGGLKLTEVSLVLVLSYHNEGQRALELTLSETGARLHFHKKD